MKKIILLTILSLSFSSISQAQPLKSSNEAIALTSSCLLNLMSSLDAQNYYSAVNKNAYEKIVMIAEPRLRVCANYYKVNIKSGSNYKSIVTLFNKMLDFRENYSEKPIIKYAVQKELKAIKVN